MKRQEIRYVVKRKDGMFYVERENNGLVLATISNTGSKSRPFQAFVDQTVLIGSYRTVVAAVEGVAEYWQIIRRIDLVAADLYGETL